MYPKNAASPQRIAIGAVVQISDGAVQTSGVSVKVMPQAGAAGAGGGTVAYEEGIVHYVPTQAETNYASFMLIAYKTGCIPVSATIVTTASGVAGYAGLDWATINAPTTTVGLSGTTVGVLTTYTGNTPQTGDSFARLGAPAGASTAADIAAIQAKTTNLPAAPASTTNITAGTITTVTNLTNLPAITANWLTAAGTAADFGAEIADAVWDEAIAGHAVAGSTGEALSAAGGAGDPWITALPGAYSAGQAGKIVGDYLNAAVGSVPTATQNADALLNRDMSAVSDTNARSPLNALRFLRNKWSVAAGTLTVTKENDSTSAWTATVTTDAAAEPIIGNDPA